MAAENVLVAIRWRPLIKRELKEDQTETEWTWTEKTITTKNADKVTKNRDIIFYIGLIIILNPNEGRMGRRPRSKTSFIGGSLQLWVLN